MRTKRLLGLVAVVVLVVAACGETDDAGDATNQPTTRVAEPGEVADLEDGTQVVTQGALVISGETRLCELLAESFPPQCGGGSVVLADLDPDDVVALQMAGDSQGIEVRWTDYPLALIGTVEGGVLVNTEPAGRVYEAVGGGLRVRLMPAQTPFFPRPLRSGEPVWWAINVTNMTDESIPVTFGSSKRADVTISDGENELYRWSDGKVFAQQVVEEVLEADAVGPVTLNDMLVAPAGTSYTLRGWIVGTGARDVVVTAPVEVIEN